MKACAVFAIAAASLIGAVSPGPQPGDGMPREASAAERPSAAERRATLRRETTLKGLRRTSREAIVWGNEKPPNRSIVLRLDPPLEKSEASDRVEVELYSTFVDDDGTSGVDACARELVLGTWWPSIEQAGLPVSLTHRQVDEGPGLDDRYHAVRRQVSELVAGGAWFAANGDERGLEVVKAALQRVGEGASAQGLSEDGFTELLSTAGIGAKEWEAKTGKPVHDARSQDHARWTHMAEQYLEKYRDQARLRSVLGLGASPFLVIDGRYVVTAHSVWRQGGRRATEKLFQTVNSLIRMQLASHNYVKTTKEPKMNYTAAALATATMLLASCAPTSYDPEKPQPWRGGWKVESGKVEIFPDAAHLRMKRSGTVLRIIFLEPLEGEQASEARRYIERLTEDREVTCGWPHGWGTKDNPMAISDDGHPIASCKLAGAHERQSCSRVPCYLEYRVLHAGYGKYAAGPWEHRTERNQRKSAIRRSAADAKKMKIGIWK